MTLTHKERVLRTMRRQPVDYVPSNLEFSTPLAARIATSLAIPTRDLMTVFDNHIVYAYLSDEDHREGGVIYDNWAVGAQEQEGAAIVGHPLADRAAVERYVFPDPNAPGLLDDIEKTVEAYGAEYFVASYQRWLLFERLPAGCAAWKTS